MDVKSHDLQVLGVDYLLGTDDGWPYLLGIAVFPRYILYLLNILYLLYLLYLLNLLYLL